MEENEKKFLEILRYLGFIKDEKVKIQRFLSGFPSFYRDIIHFDEPRTFEGAIRKSKYLYGKNKGRYVVLKSWRDSQFPLAQLVNVWV